MKIRPAHFVLALLPTAALAFPQRDVPTVGGGLAKVTYVKSNLSAMKSALEGFRRDCGRFPTTNEGLAALIDAPASTEGKWAGPYVSTINAHDAWARPFWYVATGSGFAIASFGADGKPGGKGMDEDLAITD